MHFCDWPSSSRAIVQQPKTPPKPPGTALAEAPQLRAPGKVRSWLLTVCANEARQAVRRQRRGDVLGASEYGPLTSATALLYPHSYPQAGRNPPELAGADRNNRAQPEPIGRFPRFRYAVPALISRPDPCRCSDRAFSFLLSPDLSRQPSRAGARLLGICAARGLLSGCLHRSGVRDSAVAVIG